MTTLENLPGLHVYPRSVVEQDGVTYFLARGDSGKCLGILGDATGFAGEHHAGSEALLCPLTPANAAALRERLPWLRPQPLGLKKSVGCGDRLGMATPGHIRALRAVGGMTPILAQQSVRENTRINRHPQQVMDAATWGIFEEGWREPWGADADHQKTTEHLDQFVAAGYTFFTIDPGDRVDNDAHTAPLEVLRAKLSALPWDALEDSPAAMRARYLGRDFSVESFTMTFDEEALLRAACKYGLSIAHTAHMYRHLAAAMGERPFELEVSVDETETPTSLLEHLFIASEMKRLGVRWVSLAPRYIGQFEKGVDYIGDLGVFEAEFIQHAAIARQLGPYKLSLHSGSDKFSIYPIVARHAGDLVHLKTAGTSLLEAQRVVASVDPALFREMLALAHERFAVERATYHISADPNKVPQRDALPDEALAGLLDQTDSRQLLHVTFGSMLNQYGERLKADLAAHEEAHYAALEAHFIKHLTPFVNG